MDCSSMPGSPSFTLSQCLLKLLSTESVMLSNRLILCCPLLLSPSFFPSTRIFSWDKPLSKSYKAIQGKAVKALTEIFVFQMQPA